VASPAEPELKLLRASSRPPIAFDEIQQQIINHRGTPLVVIGGPGTGKSATLVARAKSYIASGTDPNKILVITYDRHRASELSDEIFAESKQSIAGSLVKTFPALAFAILRIHRAQRGERAPRLRSGPEQEYLIRELLAGSHESNTHNWPENLREAAQTRAFAGQLRDLISRATENGLTPDALSALGRSQNFPLWESASSFLREYTQVSGLANENAFDPSEMIYQATQVLQSDLEFLRDIRSRHEVILVDEFHESDQAHRQLLDAIFTNELTLFVDPDSAVGRFRGADPESIPEIFDRYRAQMPATSARDAAPTKPELQSVEKIVLTRDYRANKQINSFATEIAKNFTYSRIIEHRNRKSERVTLEDSSSIQVIQSESVHDEARFIAARFQQLHLRDGIPYSQMAVIIRSPSTRATTLRRIFTSMNIPVREEIQSLPLNAQPAVAPLITLASLAFALNKKSVAREQIEELLPHQLIDDLLLSRYGGADFLTLKRIRASIINNREEGDSRTSYQIIRELLTFSIADVDWNEFAPIKRIADLIAAGRKAARPGATSEDVLWAIWSSATDESGAMLSQRWQRDAIAGDQSADRDLDGVVALFEAAARYTDQRPGNSGDAFIRQLVHESIASDTIAAQAQRPDVVSILTTHAAKGREWSVVAVAGVEEGVWPNLTPRGSLLGSERLVETLRSSSAHHRTTQEFQLSALSALKDDERRLFYNAITRARDFLIVSATSAEESRPSHFFNEIAEFLELEEHELGIEHRTSILTPSHLVARLRMIAEGVDSNESDSENVSAATRGAVAILAHLHRSGVRVANPDTWYGAGQPSTTMPLFTPEEQIRISPSSLETLHKCPLKWVFEHAGGRDSDSTAQIIGTSFHAIAAKLHEGATLPQLQSEMNALWQQLADRMELGTGWSAKAELERALTMLEKLVTYQGKSGRTLIGVEEKFSIKIGNITISGTVDRLEVTASGELFVVDLKTSKYPISLKDGREHPQLKVYQLAITEGKFAHLAPGTSSAGAELFYPSSGKSGAPRPQPPIDSNEVKEMIVADGQSVSAHTFLASENELCDNCALKSSCPVRPEGRSLR
jgi:superfamily I DNA/RNA helicase/RecB family exonuclease